jgi:AGZA family xanthine/uracil permease-like MFS transporter
MLKEFFKLQELQTTISTEITAGFATFLAMSYILFVNPTVLAHTGMDAGAVFTATCIAAAFGSALMGLLANYPIALAPGMGLNAYFTYSVVLGSGYTWQVALGAVFISGIIFIILIVTPMREYIIDSIPGFMKVAIVAGIGLFLSIIGFKNAGIITADPATFFKLSNLHQPTTLLAIAGFFLIVGLEVLGVIGAIIISILTITVIGILFGYAQLKGIYAMPPSVLPTLLQMDIRGAFSLGLVTIVFAFLFVDLFDNTGTLIGIAYRAGLVTKDGKIPRLKGALIADSCAAIMSALVGTSTTTSYLESMVGVKVGGRSGLTAVVVAILFLIAMFLSPLAASIPVYATAPALLYVACLMTKSFGEIGWHDPTEYIPAIIIAVTMPLTFSVAEGIAFGFISYVVIKIITGRYRELNWAVFVLAILFTLREVLLT